MELGNPVKGLAMQPVPKRRMISLLATMFSLVVADGVITSFLIQNGLASEANPLLRPIVDGPAFLPLKIAAAIAGALVLWHVYLRKPSYALAGSVSVVVMYTFIVSWNIFAFIATQV